MRVAPYEIPEGKTCITCRVYFNIDQFHRDGNRKDNHAPQCKPCKNAASAAYRKNNPERFRVIDRRQTLRGHGLTEDDYIGLLENQEGQCAICGTAEAKGRGRFHIDHDHNCCPGSEGCPNCIRGLLCNNCNQGLGKFADSIELLSAAIGYLTATSVTTTTGAEHA